MFSSVHAHPSAAIHSYVLHVCVCHVHFCLLSLLICIFLLLKIGAASLSIRAHWADKRPLYYGHLQPC